MNSNKLVQIDKMIQIVSSLDPDCPVFISELFTGWFQTWNVFNRNMIMDEGKEYE